MFIQTEIEANRVRIRDMRKQGVDHVYALREWQDARMCARSGNTVAAFAHYRACLQALKAC